MWHELIVYGHRPVPQGSMVAYFHKALKRCANKPSNEPSLKAYRRALTATMRTAGGRPRTPLDGPVEVELGFQFMRGPSHYLTRVGGRVLRPDAAVWCATSGTGDIDKLTRAVFDAMSDAAWWVDDSRAVDVRARAWWGSVDAVMIRAREIAHPAAGMA